MPLQQNPIKHRWEGLDRVEAAEYIVQLRDVFKLDFLYTIIHDWIVDEGWGPRDDTKFLETYYTQRDHPQFGKEIWVRWRLWKDSPGAKPGGKVSLFKWMMDLDFKIIGLKDAEIVYKNQKIKMDKGEFELTCRSAVVIDYGGAFEKAGFAQRFTNFLFARRVHRRRLGAEKKMCIEESYRLREFVLNYFKLENMFPEKEMGEVYVKRTME